VSDVAGPQGKSRVIAQTLKAGGRGPGALPHPEPISAASYSAVELMAGAESAVVLDQRRLPHEEHYDSITTVDEMADAIRGMAVRGAPAIGIAAAYGMVLAAGAAAEADPETFLAAMRRAATLLHVTRPTAVNLAWAIGKMYDVAREVAATTRGRLSRMAEAARAIHRDDVAACREMGRLGAELLPNKCTVLTHCNAGALATGGYGTALGVIRAARAAGKEVRVLATETRPYLQGARLTAWELAKDDIPVELITDGMVAHFMGRGAIDAVVVGADRISRCGDVANKIGTYGIACIAYLHEVPMYVAAPWSTVDLDCPTGMEIPIEERSDDEVTSLLTKNGLVRIAAPGVIARHPAFDVTPATFIRAIMTERGVFPPASLASG
jgi:methylthioribose-1-phosphate isomerase